MDVTWVWKVESYPGIYTGIYYEKDLEGLYFYYAFPFRHTDSSPLSLRKKYYFRQWSNVFLADDSFDMKFELRRDRYGKEDSRRSLNKLAPSFPQLNFNLILAINSIQLLLDNFEEIKPLIDKVIVKEML